MLSFSEFLYRIRWSWLAGIATLLITIAIGAITYRYESSVTIPNRIAFFQTFLYGPFMDENAKEEDMFALRVHTLLGEDTPLSFQRIAALRAFLSEKVKDKRDSFLGLDLETATTLVLHRERIPLLIQKEEEYGAALRFNWLTGLHKNWLWGFHPAILAWQVASVLCLLFYWVAGSYAMSYFPYRKWWFWSFSILAFPWSFLLGVALAVSLVTNGISKLIAYERQRRSRRPSYDEFCVSLRQNLPHVREQWEAFFPTTLGRQKIRELAEKVGGFRQKLVELGEEIEKRQGEYVTSRAALERLTTESAAYVDRDEELWKKEWREELKGMLANPHVKGVGINTEYLRYGVEVYTGTFTTLWGNLGPMKIVIDLENGSFNAELAHNAAVLGSIGQGNPHSFCFGTVTKTIGGLIREHKINDALGVMIASFEAGVDVGLGL